VSAAIRCCCGRCTGGVTYLRHTDWLAAHQLGPGEFVLESEVEEARSNHPSTWASIERRTT